MVLEVKDDCNPQILVDKYEEHIELQNSCRSFYLRRKKESEDFKKNLLTKADIEEGTKKRTSLSSAMDRLRTEMASLIDQDLSLMEQLLTLNEKIEDLKSQRLYGVAKDSLDDSTDDFSLKAPCHSSTNSKNSDSCHNNSGRNWDIRKEHHYDNDSDSGYGE